MYFSYITLLEQFGVRQVINKALNKFIILGIWRVQERIDGEQAAM